MPTIIEGIKFYTIPEVAKVLRVTSQTTRKYIKEGRLKAIRIGRPQYITETSLKAFLGGV